MEFTKTYKQEKGAEHFCGGKKRHCQANVNTNTQMINNTDIQHTYSMVAEANNNKQQQNIWKYRLNKFGIQFKTAWKWSTSVVYRDEIQRNIDIHSHTIK